jgi:hypothetical protein
MTVVERLMIEVDIGSHAVVDDDGMDGVSEQQWMHELLEGISSI